MIISMRHETPEVQTPDSKPARRPSRLSYLAFLVLFCAPIPHLHAQASAIPSAQSSPDVNDPAAGRKLLDEMVTALGGPAWLNRTDYTYFGQSGTFYKGYANPYVTQFERYVRLDPYGERIIIVSKQGVLIPTTKRDVAEIWTPDSGYEVTYKGKKTLPQKDIDEFQRNRKHSLDTVMREWVKQPGILITYEGTALVDRKIADKLSILTATNDGVEIFLDESTHLPMSMSYQWRDPLYRDFNTETLQFNDYHEIEGVMTPMTLTRLHNGDMTTQIFVKQVHYNTPMPADLFDPDRPLKESAKK
jgi:hypothetical protein